MVKKTKMDSAKDQATHMSKVIRTRQKEQAKAGGSAAGAMAGIGGGSFTDEQTSADAGGFGAGFGAPSAGYGETGAPRRCASFHSRPL